MALISLLFARPYMLATEQRAGDRLIVVLLDLSASMGLQGESRPIDQAAARRARAIVGSAGQGAQLEVATFGETVRAHCPSRRILLTVALEPSPAGILDYGVALGWARDILVRSRNGIKDKELHVLTDLQRSGLNRGPSVSPPEGALVHLHDFGRAFAKNVAVTSVTIAPKTVRPGESATVTATILNTSALPVVGCPVRLSIEAGKTKRESARAVDLEADATRPQTCHCLLDSLPEGALARVRRGTHRVIN